MKRLAALAIAAGLTLAPTAASAAPSRVSCEQAAIAAANASAKPHDPAWGVIYALAYARCLNGSTLPDYRKPMPKRWTPTRAGWIYAPVWVL